LAEHLGLLHVKGLPAKRLDEIVSASVATRRFQAPLIVLFAALSLALAVVGVSGVMTYAVARQTHEIGVRVALGAQRSTVLRTVLLQGLRPVVAGLAVGSLAAAVAARSLQSFLFGIEPLDPIALGTAGDRPPAICPPDGRPTWIHSSRCDSNEYSR
jgi:predicted lysophospholipase L1 biosynthesis ABC-type transport system permease subunit